MLKSLLDDKPEPEQRRPFFKKPRTRGVITLFDDPENEGEKEEHVISPSEPESAGENARRSGLAFSAGIAFFGAVVFMLILGWLADLMLGSSPWGIVGGIVLGSLIGFIQFFRLTSQIFRK